MAAAPSPAQLVSLNDSNELLLVNALSADDKRETTEHDEVLQEIHPEKHKGVSYNRANGHIRSYVFIVHRTNENMKGCEVVLQKEFLCK